MDSEPRISDIQQNEEKADEKLFHYNIAKYSGLVMVFFDRQDDKKAGDAILIRSSEGKIMLINGGRTTARPTVYSYLKSMGIRSVDYLVAMHLHIDHVGGFPEIIEEMKIGEVFMPNVPIDAEAALNFLTALHTHRIVPKILRDGDSFAFGEDCMTEVLNPLKEEVPASMVSLEEVGGRWVNNLSLVLKLTYGKVSMLITGDITEEKEIDLEKLHSSRLHADILKIPHHGAKTSSSELFLHTVSPDISVIPSDRIYDEPTYNRIKAMTHGEVFMPGLDGNILIATDGVRISVVTEKEHCFKSAKQQTSEIGWGNKCII